MEEAYRRRIVEWYFKHRAPCMEGENLGAQEARRVYRIDDDTPAETWYNDDTTVLGPWDPTEADIQMLQGCNIDWL